MQLKIQKARAFVPVYANNLTAFNPELWANESLAILEEKMIVAGLVHRDFEPVIAKFGSVVHTRRPGTFEAKRKDITDQVTVQDATATDVLVPMNQQPHVSFLIYDGEEARSFKDLVQTYLSPAMLAMSQFIDRMLLGQYFRFLGNSYGGLGLMTASNARDYVLGVREIMNINKAYEEGRKLILTPSSETSLLKLDLLQAAYAVGDSGEALRKAYLGQKWGFDMFMCQNAGMVRGSGSTAPTTLSGAINGGNLTVGSTVLTVNGFTGAVVTGDWITIAGDMYPYRISAHTETLGNTVSITLDSGLHNAILTAAVVTTYKSGATVGAGTYTGGTGATIGFAKDILTSSGTVAPQIGQIVTFGTSLTSPVYSVLSVNGTTSIRLDRPLEATITTGDVIHFGPAGNYNMAFHRDALALVCRPLATPMPGAGAQSAVVNHGNMSIRITISYQARDQGHLVTLDALCGVALLDANLGAVLLG